MAQDGAGLHLEISPPGQFGHTSVLQPPPTCSWTRRTPGPKRFTLSALTSTTPTL